jgi:peroxiredoxin Q/BCP
MIKSSRYCLMKITRCFAAILFLCPLCLCANPGFGLEVGQPAPDFALPDQFGKVHRLTDYRGKVVILAFYPKDMTAGCTCEMKALRDVVSELKKKNAVVFGISADTVESHKEFAAKEGLDFPLLADPGKKIVKAYGVLGVSGYPDRVTFIIGPDGTVVSIDRAVNAQFYRESGPLLTRHGAHLVMLLSGWKAKVGGYLPNFSLPGTDGKTVSLLSPGKKATVVVFLSKNCPVSQGYEARLAALAADPAYKDVAFLGLFPNTDETAAQVRAYAAKRKFPFPIAKDAGGRLADRFGAHVAPTAWVVTAQGMAVYAGAIDDNSAGKSVPANYLKDALDATLAGRPVAVPHVPATGCPLVRSVRP